MAHKKSSKGKDESRPTITARNKAARQARNDKRAARLVERTQKLIGQHVKYRDKESNHGLVGTVTDVLRKGDDEYPQDAKRKYGAYLKIRTPEGAKVVSRHRVKLIKKES